MAYVGTPLDTTNAFQSLAGKRFSGDGSTTDFTLDSSPNSTLDIEVFVGNVRQDPNSAYTVSGTTLGFTGAPPSGTNNIYVVHQAKAVGTIDPAVGSTLDLNGAAELVLDADADTAISADAADDQIDIKIGGNDDFKLTAKTLTIGGGAAADTAIVFDGNAQDYYIGLDDSGDEFQIGKGSTLAAGREFSIGASGPVFNEDSDTHDFRVETDDQTHAFFIHGANDKASFNEDSPDTDAGGLCLNHGSNDAAVFTFKNSDVAHGITDQVQTDTYAYFSKFSGAQGGLQLMGFSEGEEAIFLHGVVTTNDTAKSGSALAPVMVRGNVKSGTNIANMGANANVFLAQNGGNAVFLVDEDGDIHYDGSDAGAYDSYDDAHMVRALDLSRDKNLAGVIDSKFDDYVKYNHETLANAKLVGREKDGTPNHFVNITGMQRLHNGAIWQQYEKHERLLEAVYDLAKEAVGEDKANAILGKHEIKRLQ
jgi:hypothetical protein